MPERAEIEAVAAIIERWKVSGAPTSLRNGMLIPDCTAEIVAYLDRVRDARDDDECREGRHEWAVSGDPATTCARCGVPWASPSRDGTVAVDQPEPDALGGLPPSQPKEDQ